MFWLAEGDALDYNNWQGGQPSSAEEACLVLGKFTGEGYQWWDDECDSRHFYIGKISKFHNCPCILIVIVVSVAERLRRWTLVVSHRVQFPTAPTLL